MDSNIKIIIATHKIYQMPQDPLYIPVQVGAEGKNDIGYQRDNIGENISSKNPNYCELTGLFWAWKNLNADYIGLAHYRRHFSYKKKKDKFSSILTNSEAARLCSKYDVIVPKKRRYFIETLESHYYHTHDGNHLEFARQVIKEKCPEYLPTFERVMKRSGAHMFNMFIMKKELLDQYCSWVFDILFEIEKRINLKDLSAFDARLFGRISELLLDVWLTKNNISYKEIPFIQLGNENWFQKIKGFIEAKYFGKKYSCSK
jgi:hypothetical protein